MKKGLKGYFITGLLVVLPLYLTVYVLSIIVRFMDSIFVVMPVALQPDTYLPFHIPGLGIIVTFAGILIVGLLTTNLLGRKLLELAEGLMTKVPLVRPIYNSSKQLMETFFKKDNEGFKKVVLIEFPKTGVYSVGFLTGKVKGELKAKTGEDNVSIFIPCTPNPTTGYYIVARERDVIYLDMKAEDAFKLIMTGGLVVPKYDEYAHLTDKGPIDASRNIDINRR
ncbi:MAG: DUF502 domain-containing protein [Deltaproteobacteria bacterium]|nr:DUF502 domain-containing protein [Deltaproteobacteria bacterium]